jgi:hypothetical protein
MAEAAASASGSKAASLIGSFGAPMVNVGDGGPLVDSGILDARDAMARGFAKGGIMTPFGPAALRKYANGGIADRPQLALFGEGDQNEAYVPLPDGRRIPVALQGGGRPAGGGNVTVNVINETGQQFNAEQSAPRFDGERMVLDVVLKAMHQPGPFRDSIKQAVR